MKRAHIRGAGAATVLMAALATILGFAAPVAAQGDATWSGDGSADIWSNAGNWSGAAAPSGSVDQLTLPPSRTSCASWQCTFSVDDIPSLSVGVLQIDSSTNYVVAPMDSGDQLTLRGGLDFSTTTAPAGGRLSTKMVVPLDLGAPQTWQLSGAAGVPTQLTLGAVTGEPYALTLRLSGDVSLQAPELDSGELTIAGGGLVSLTGQTTTPADGIPVSPPALISSQGVLLEDGGSLMVNAAGAVSGPIVVAPGSYSTLEVGHGAANDGTLVVDGDVTLRANSTLALWIDLPAGAGTRVPQPSSDYSQLTAFGSVQLNNASLGLSQGFSSTQVECAPLVGGQVYTLISALKLTGTFSGIADRQVVPLGVCDPLAARSPYAAVVSYNTDARPETVTATIVGPAQIAGLVRRTLSVPAAVSTVQSVLGSGGYATTFEAPAAGTLDLSWTTRVRGRPVRVASGSVLAGQIGPRRVPIELTAAGRRLLLAAAAGRPLASAARHHKKRPRPPRPESVTVTATARFAAAGGQAAVTASRTIRLAPLRPSAR